jgi:hypothetical protein
MTCEPTPASLTGQQKDTICGILSVGCDRQTAADYVGCSLADIRCQLQHDRQFLASVRRAEAGIELSHMRNVQEAAKAKKDWRASVWWLERHSPERFARRSPGAITVRQLKSFVAILVDALRENIASPEDRGRVVARLNAIAESVEQMLLDAHAIPTESLDAEQSCNDDTGDSTSSSSFVQGLLSFEGMD